MKQKLERFRIISERDNVLEPGKEIYFEVKGHWNEQFFKRALWISLIIYIPSITDHQDKDGEDIILDLVDDAVVADPDTIAGPAF